MATRLKNILSFTNLAAGASVVLPHELNWNDVPRVPDVVVSLASLSITADDEAVTVTNDSDGPRSGLILVESWHTVERAFGDAADLVLPVQPYVVIAEPGAAGGQTFSFVYRPGDLTPGGNVFADWAALVGVMAATPGYKLLAFDDELAPVVIPAGVWDMTNVVWTGLMRDTGAPVVNTIVDVSEGAVFTKLRNFGGPLTVRNLATATPPISDLVGGEHLVMGLGLQGAQLLPVLQNLGTAPFIDASGIGVGETAFLTTIGSIGGGVSVSPAVEQNGPGNLVVSVGTALDDDMLGGAGPGAYTLFRTFNTGTLGQQTVFGGILVRTFQSQLRTNYGLAPAPPTPPSAVPVVAGHNDFVMLDASGGAIVQPLPPIKLQPAFQSPGGCHLDSRGMRVVVKETSGSVGVTVAPFAGETIDGGAGAVAVPAGGARIFLSDGVSNWHVIL